MKRAPALIASLLFLAGPAVRAQLPNPAPPPPPKPVAEYDATNWGTFELPEGGFSISMPGAPAAFTEPVDTALGRLTMHLYVLTTAAGEYGVSYADFPVGSDDPAAIKRYLDGARDEMLARGAKRLNENDVTVDGAVGRELILEQDGVIGRQWIFLVKGRLYAVIFSTSLAVAFKDGKQSSPDPRDRTDLYESIGKKFFGSFKFIPRTEAPSQSAQSNDVLAPVAVKTDLYPANADAKKEIEAALTTARGAGKRVMLIFGGNWCYDCHVLNQALHTGEAGKIVEASYLLVHVNIGEGDKNLDLVEKYKSTLNKGVPTISILASDGRVIYSSTNGEFEPARSMLRKDLVAFLNRWKTSRR